jgi:hypothetical protein
LKKHFVTFASRDLQITLLRIKMQAAKIGTFDFIHCFTEDMLAPEFRKHFSSRLWLGTRGFGYWCWKPQILLQTIQKAQDGDLILYCDAGCEINANGGNVLQSYFSDAQESEDGFVVFQLESKETDPYRYIEERWTKEDLFAYFRVSANDPIRTSNQIASGIFLFRVDEKSTELIREWRDIYYIDFDLATDKPSQTKNIEKFNENRHDQSIFSLLIKQRNVKIRSFCELERPSNGEPETARVQAIIAAQNRKFTFLTRKKKQIGRFSRKIRRIFSKVI